jgi:hypothetical protein
MLLIPAVPTEKMSALIALLYDVNNEGMWGISIREVLSSGNIKKLTTLINELRDQAADDKDVMINIIGEPCYTALMAL